MQRDIEDKARLANGGAQEGRLIQAVAETAIAADADRKVLQPAQDGFWLAGKEVADLVREAAAFPITSSGPIVPAGFQRRLDRARGKREQAEHEYLKAAERAQKSSSAHNKAQKALETWRMMRAYHADQAAQDAARTPEERERRRIRDLVAAERVRR